jgi:cell wall-associated NlpC family hydrolase
MFSTAWRRTSTPATAARREQGGAAAGRRALFGWGPTHVNHVGIYIGGGQMVHASTYSTGVITSTSTQLLHRALRRGKAHRRRNGFIFLRPLPGGRGFFCPGTGQNMQRRWQTTGDVCAADDGKTAHGTGLRQG